MTGLAEIPQGNLRVLLDKGLHDIFLRNRGRFVGANTIQGRQSRRGSRRVAIMGAIVLKGRIRRATGVALLFNEQAPREELLY